VVRHDLGLLRQLDAGTRAQPPIGADSGPFSRAGEDVQTGVPDKRLPGPAGSFQGSASARA
jgi:hypothetical protein